MYGNEGDDRDLGVRTRSYYGKLLPIDEKCNFIRIGRGTGIRCGSAHVQNAILACVLAVAGRLRRHDAYERSASACSSVQQQQHEREVNHKPSIAALKSHG